MKALSGQTIRGYEIGECIGSGGYGEIYRAIQLSVERDVAIKIILPQYANDPKFVAEFEAEAKLIAQLEHTNIVPLHDYWRDETGAFLVMRYVRGGSLQEIIETQGTLSLARTTRLIEQIANALTVAHDAGVVHRDLKPANILIDQRGSAYLTDFGIAKQLSGKGISGESGAVKGTFAYMSPEQIHAEKLTPQTDIYALGVILHEMLAGRHPFAEIPVGTLLIKHMQEQLPNIHDIRDDLPYGIDHIIQKATEKDPADRYSSALELVSALKAALNSAPAGKLHPAMTAKTKPATLEERNRGAMLTNVRKFWVEGVLENSLHNTAMIDLGLKTEAGAVDSPWDTLIRTPAGDETLTDERILDVFDRMNGKLLILGDPGSGKTITLLTLSRALLDRAEADQAHPIPIVLNLSSWWKKQLPLTDWIGEELNRMYQVPRKVGSNWVESDELLLLLDGLDEVGEATRENCIAAINDYRREHGFVDVVVCSRIDDYERLDAQLLMNGAVVIQPLDRVQIKAYLDALGPRLAPIVTLVDRDDTLYELCQSPLMLSVIALTYTGKTNTPLTGTDVETLRRNLFDAYAEKQLDRHNRSAPYSRTQILNQLHWLAKQMQLHGQSTFEIERLQPTWGDQEVAKRFTWHYRLIVIVLWAFAWGLSSLLVPEFNPRSWQSILPWGAFGAVMGTILTTQRYNSIPAIVAVGIGSASIMAFLGNPLFDVIASGAAYAGAYWSMVSFLRRDNYKPDVVQPIDNLHFRWRRVRYVLTFMVAAALASEAFEGEPTIGTTTLVFAAILSLAIHLVGVGWFTGLTSDRVEQTMQPNQGIRNSLRTGLRVGGIFGGVLWLGMISGLVIVDNLTNAMLQSSYLGVLVFFHFSFAFGLAPVIQHIVLRRLLTRHHQLPRNYAAFLNHTARLILLRRVGGVYIFPHRYLLEHFATLEPDKKT